MSHEVKRVKELPPSDPIEQTYRVKNEDKKIVYRNYLECEETEFNLTNCTVNQSNLSKAFDRSLRFDSLVEYKFNCSSLFSGNKLQIGLETGDSGFSRVSLETPNWTELAVVSWRESPVLKDKKPHLTFTSKFSKENRCELNIRTKKIISPELKVETRKKLIG